MVVIVVDDVFVLFLLVIYVVVSVLFLFRLKNVRGGEFHFELKCHLDDIILIESPSSSAIVIIVGINIICRLEMSSQRLQKHVPVGFPAVSSESM